MPFYEIEVILFTLQIPYRVHRTSTAAHTARQMSSVDCSKDPSGNPGLVHFAMCLRAGPASRRPFPVNRPALALSVPTSTPIYRPLSSDIAAPGVHMRSYEGAWFIF